MRIAFVLLLSLPLLIEAEYDCKEMKEQLEKERREDENKHGCRSCPNPMTSDAHCPFGMECSKDWPFTSEVLTSHDSCKCSILKCSGGAKLVVDGKIVHKMNCSNGQWTVDGESSGSAICAKSCNSGVCNDKNPLTTSPDFVRLNVESFGGSKKCATGTCEHGMVSIKDDGTVDETLSASEVTCSADGLWKAEGREWKYVMCTASEPACKNVCTDTPFLTFSVSPGPYPEPLIQAIKDGCSYTCPPGLSLFKPQYRGPGVYIPISIEIATCESDGNFLVNGNEKTFQVGCWGCDLGDVAEYPAETLVKPSLKKCVLSCPGNYQVQYSINGAIVNTLPRMFRYVFVLNGGNYGIWYDNGPVPPALTFSCVP